MTEPTGSTLAFNSIAGGTAHSTPRSIVSLALAASLAFTATPSFPLTRGSASQTPGGTGRVVLAPVDRDQSIVLAMSSLYDRLISNSRPFPEAAAVVLYQNLWDMYED